MQKLYSPDREFRQGEAVDPVSYVDNHDAHWRRKVYVHTGVQTDPVDETYEDDQIMGHWDNSYDTDPWSGLFKPDLRRSSRTATRSKLLRCGKCGIEWRGDRDYMPCPGCGTFGTLIDDNRYRI